MSVAGLDSRHRGAYHVTRFHMEIGLVLRSFWLMLVSLALQVAVMWFAAASGLWATPALRTLVGKGAFEISAATVRIGEGEARQSYKEAKEMQLDPAVEGVRIVMEQCAALNIDKMELTSSNAAVSFREQLFGDAAKVVASASSS